MKKVVLLSSVLAAGLMAAPAAYAQTGNGEEAKVVSNATKDAKRTAIQAEIDKYQQVIAEFDTRYPEYAATAAGQNAKAELIKLVNAPHPLNYFGNCPWGYEPTSLASALTHVDHIGRYSDFDWETFVNTELPKVESQIQALENKIKAAEQALKNAKDTETYRNLLEVELGEYETFPDISGVTPAAAKAELQALIDKADTDYKKAETDIANADPIDQTVYETLTAEVETYKQDVRDFYTKYNSLKSNKGAYDELISDVQTEDWKSFEELQKEYNAAAEGIKEQFTPSDYETKYRGLIEDLQNRIESAYVNGKSAEQYEGHQKEIRDLHQAIEDLRQQIRDLIKANDDAYTTEKDNFANLTVPTDLVDYVSKPEPGSTVAEADVHAKAEAAKTIYNNLKQYIEDQHTAGKSDLQATKDMIAKLTKDYEDARTAYADAWTKAANNDTRYANDLAVVEDGAEFALPAEPKTWDVNPTDKDDPDAKESDKAKTAVETAYNEMKTAYDAYLAAAEYDWDNEVDAAAHAANTETKLATYKSKFNAFNTEVDKAKKNDAQYKADVEALVALRKAADLEPKKWEVDPTEQDANYELGQLDAGYSYQANENVKKAYNDAVKAYDKYNTEIQKSFDAETSVADKTANADLLKKYNDALTAYDKAIAAAEANDAHYKQDVADIFAEKQPSECEQEWKVDPTTADVPDKEYSDDADALVQSMYGSVVTAYKNYLNAIKGSFEAETSVADHDTKHSLEAYKTAIKNHADAVAKALANDKAYADVVPEVNKVQEDLTAAVTKYGIDPWSNWSAEFTALQTELTTFNTDLQDAFEHLNAVEWLKTHHISDIADKLAELIKKIEENHGDYNHAKDYSNDLNHLLETIEQTLEADIVKRADHTGLTKKDLFTNDEVYNDLNKYFEDTYPEYDIDALKVDHDLSKVIGNLTAQIRQDFLDHKAHETLGDRMKEADAIKACLEDLQAKAEELIAANLAAHDQQIADLGDKVVEDEWHTAYKAIEDATPDKASDRALEVMKDKLDKAQTAWETAKAEIEKHYNDGDANHDDVKAAIAALDKAYEEAVEAYNTAVQNAKDNQAAYDRVTASIADLQKELETEYNRFKDTESVGALANRPVEKKKVQDAIDKLTKDLHDAWNNYKYQGDDKRADEVEAELNNRIKGIRDNELKHFKEWIDAEIFNQEAYVELTANKKAVQDDLDTLFAAQPKTDSTGAKKEMADAKKAAQDALNAIDIKTPYDKNPLHGPAIDAAKKKALQDAIDAAQVLVNKYFDLCKKAEKNEEVYQAKLKEYKAAWDQAAQDAADNAAGKFCFKSEKGYDPAEESATAHANIEAAAAEQAAALAASKKELEDQYNYVPATSSLVKNVGEAVGTRKSVWVEDVTAAEYENLVKENGEFKAEVEKAQANIDAYEEKYDRIQNELQKPLTALVNYYKSDSWTNWDAEKTELQNAINDLITNLKAAYQAETAVAFDVENPIKFIAYATDMLEKYINANMDAYNVIKSAYDDAEDMIREIKKFYDMAQPGVQDDLRAELGLADTFRTDYINEITDGIANAQQHCKDHLYVKDEAGHLTETSDKYTEDKTYLDDLGAADALKDAHYAVDGKAGLAEILQTLMKYIDANDAAYAEQTNDLKDSFEASEPLEVYTTESTTAKQDLIDKEAAVHTAYNTAHDAIEKSYNDGTSVKDDAANKALVDAYDAAVAAYQQAVLDAKHNDTVKAELDGVIAGHKSYYDEVVASDAKLAAGELYGSTTAQADVADKRDKAAKAKADAEKALADTYNAEKLVELGVENVVKSAEEADVEQALADYKTAVDNYKEALRKANLNDAKNDELNKKLDAAKAEYKRVLDLDVTPTASTEGQRIVADAYGELETALTNAANALANNYDDELLIKDDVVKTVEGLIAEVNTKAKAYEAAVKQANDNEAANVVVSGAIADATAAADALETFINGADWEIIKTHYDELLNEVDGYRDQIQDITDRLFEAYDEKADAQSIKDQLLSELKDLLATLKQDLADAKFYNEHLGDVDLNGERDYEDYAQLIELVLAKAAANANMQADMNINDKIDGGDVVILNNWLTYGKTEVPAELVDYVVPKAKAAAEFAADMDLEANGKTVALNINNNLGFAVLQFDLYLSDGATLANLALTERAGAHMIKSRKQADGSYRVLVMNNGATTNMTGNAGAVLNLTFAGEGEIEVADVLVADVNGNTFELGSASALLGTTTGIDEVATSVDAEFYGVNGIRNTKAQQGVNIIRNTDGSVKKVIKK